MGCTHSKNSKSKSSNSKNRPIEQRKAACRSTEEEVNNEIQNFTDNVYQNEDVTQNYSRKLINELKEPPINSPAVAANEVKPNNENVPAPAIIEQKKPVNDAPIGSVYVPTKEEIKEKEEQKERHKSAAIQEIKKPRKQHRREAVKERSDTKTPNRPQFAPADLDYIKQCVQQRNERRNYMMAHRDETEDTLYELETRMPEKDYTQRYEQSARVF